MSVKENVKVVRLWNEILWDDNVDVGALDKLLHPDYANRSKFYPPWSVGLKGIAALKEELLRQRKNYASLECIIEDIIAEGDRVAARITAVLHGKPIALVMAFYRLVDGKIIDDWFTWVDIPEKPVEEVPAEAG